MKKTQCSVHWQAFSLLGALMLLATFIVACGGDDATEAPAPTAAPPTMAPATPVPTPTMAAPTPTIAPATPAPTRAATRAPAPAGYTHRNCYRRACANGHSDAASYR